MNITFIAQRLVQKQYIMSDIVLEKSQGMPGTGVGREELQASH